MDQDGTKPRYPDPYTSGQGLHPQRRQSQQQHDTLERTILHGNVGPHAAFRAQHDIGQALPSAASGSSHVYHASSSVPYDQPAFSQQPHRQQQQHQGYVGQMSTRAQQPYDYASSMAYPMSHDHRHRSPVSIPHFRSRHPETYGETQSTPHYSSDQTGLSTTTSMSAYGATHSVAHQHAATYAPNIPVVTASSAFPGNMFEPLQPTTVLQAYSQPHLSLNTTTIEQQIQQQQAQLRQNQTQQNFARYRNTIRTVFGLVRDQRLQEIPAQLIEASRQLLASVEILGLTRDEEGQHDERITLWDEFNRAWLTTLQCQFDMIQGLQAGQISGPAHSVLDYDTLKTLSRELVRLGDGLEKFGLVDYQMGVAEDEIIEILLRCLSQLESSSPTSESNDCG